MNTKLITALRTAAKAIEDGVFDYEWQRPQQCNCGVVVCALLGVSAKQLSDKLIEEGLRPVQMENPTWRRIVGQNCPITGVPQSTLFQHLYRFGFTAKEFTHLEFLNRPDILKRCGVEKLPYQDAGSVIKYLRAWAEILTEEGAEDLPERATPPLQTVSS